MTDWLHDMWRLDQLGSLTLGKPASSIDLSELPPELLPRGGTLMRLDHKEIVAAAERHGLSILLQSGRKALGERRPDTSSLLKEMVPNDDFGPAHLAYKTYSAVAHAELPGITFGMGWDLDPQSDGTYAAWRRLSPEYIAAAAGIAMLCSALATERRVHAYGSLPKVRYTAARDRAMAPFAAVMLRLVQRGR